MSIPLLDQCPLCEAIGMENRANKQFGRYEVLAELGRGAMGIVYKARDPQIGRIVALKTVSLRGQDPEQEEEFRKRFLCEAQAAGRLHHPGIVAIYDAGEDRENQDPYIVLEFVSGDALNRILTREKKLPLPRALQLAEEIAEALDYAHAQGVIHRDIKPANILITEDGHAKIADLGIAQLNLAHFTLPGRVLGTPAYMAPEQLSGESVDGRSDIFSLGVLLYAMVTGHSPFHGNSATTVCFKVVNREPVPASAFDLDLPRALDAVISRAMAKDPAQRYQRGSELAEDLRQMRLNSQPASTAALLQGLSTGAVQTNPAGLMPPAALLQGLSATGAVQPNHTGLMPPAEAGLLHAEQLLLTALQKTPVKYLILGAALVVLLIIVAIPSRHAITSQRAATVHMAAPPVSTATPVSGADGAKPRDSIVAEMDAGEPAPAVDLPAPAAPVRTNSAPRATSKRTSLKHKSVAVVSPQPANVPAAKPVPVPASKLELAVEHQFKEATLSVWVDDQLALTRPLHGGTQKRLVVFKGVRGVESESLQVPAGTHQLRVRAQSLDPAIDLSKTISADFAPGDDKTLHITFDKHNATMRLTWQ